MRAGSQLAHATNVKDSGDVMANVIAACNIIQHDWFGGGWAMVWGGVSLEGHTNLHVIAYMLPWLLLSTGMKSSDPFSDRHAGAVGPGFLLVQDNARPHVARVCRQYLDDKGIDAIDWPSYSPDLNPIKNFWDVMYRCICKKNYE